MPATPDDAPGERAGVTRRFVIVAMAVALAGFAGAAPWALPERCRWVGGVCAALCVPCGCVAAFLGARGRAEDLREFTAAKFAGDAAGEVAVAVACFAAILAVATCLR